MNRTCQGLLAAAASSPRPVPGQSWRDGTYGAIVAPGNARELAESINRAATDPDRLVKVGRRNARLIAEHYTQSDYGDALASLYHRLAAKGAGNQPSRSAQSKTFVAPKSG